MDEVDHTMETSTEHVTLGRKGEGEWREEGREMVDELVVGGWKVEEGGCMVEEGWWWWMMVGSLKAWIWKVKKAGKRQEKKDAVVTTPVLESISKKREKN